MWQEKDNSLYKKFEFNDFAQAFDFMTQVSKLAEAQNHHPRWQNVYNIVEIWLSTHAAGDKVTQKDQKLAEAIDEIHQPSKATAKLNEAKLFTDGGSRGNPGPSASGFVVLDTDDQLLASEGVYLGLATNNQAEYTALKLGLEKVINMGVKNLQVFMDSQLIINQMNGLYKVKHDQLKPLNDAICKLANNFENITFTYVPREENALADAQVNKVLDNTK